VTIEGQGATIRRAAAAPPLRHTLPTADHRRASKRGTQAMIDRQPPPRSKSLAARLPSLRLGDLLHPGTARLVISRAADRLWSTRQAIGFRRDLREPFAAPAANLPIRIVELAADTLPTMLDPRLKQASKLDVFECASRRALWARQFGRCFLALAPDDRPCFLQWLFHHEDTARLQDHFGDSFPALQADEALLEGAYTPAEFRGQRIMPAAMALIAERAADRGARYVHTFVGIDNMASLKGCVRAGFPPHQWRDQRLRLFGRKTAFGPLPPDFALHYAAIYR
jgi:GNAT superfamily N-acetyltransferase